MYSRYKTFEENKTKKGPANRSTRSTLSLQLKEMDSISDAVGHCSVLESNVAEGEVYSLVSLDHFFYFVYFMELC